MLIKFLWIFVTLLTFVIMEFVAWFSHKYIMHGFLWSWHKDHHKKDHDSWFQKNDDSPPPIIPGKLPSILNTKIIGQHLPSFSQGHWLAQETNLNERWSQIICPDFIEKNENEAEIAVKRKSVPFRWKDLIDPKNKKIGLIDLGNHILIAGVVLIGIFIISNA